MSRNEGDTSVRCNEIALASRVAKAAATIHAVRGRTDLQNPDRYRQHNRRQKSCDAHTPHRLAWQPSPPDGRLFSLGPLGSLAWLEDKGTPSPLRADVRR